MKIGLYPLYIEGGALRILTAHNLARKKRAHIKDMATFLCDYARQGGKRSFFLVNGQGDLAFFAYFKSSNHPHPL